MVRKVIYGKPRPNQVTLTLVDHFITCPCEVLEDVLVRVEGLLFPTDSVIFDMPKDSETPLLLGRTFLATCKTLIDVTLGELILRFTDEKVFFNFFEAMKHQEENLQCY